MRPVAPCVTSPTGPPPTLKACAACSEAAPSSPPSATPSPSPAVCRMTALLGISPLRGLIWGFYASLKTYRLRPNPRRAAALRTRFDRIFLRRTGFVTLDRLLRRLHANKAELLMVLDRPETPLHTNGSENDIRATSLGGRSVPEPAAMSAAIVAMLFWASPRPATSSASRSGIIWAADSRWPGTWSFNHSTITSEGGSDPLDRRRRPHFRPYYLSKREAGVSERGASSAMREGAGSCVAVPKGTRP